MITDKEIAIASVKAVSQFVMEFEGAKLRPNIVFMNLRCYNAISKNFPYLVNNLTLKYNKEEYRIIITKDTAIGMAFSFHTDFILEYNSSETLSEITQLTK